IQIFHQMCETIAYTHSMGVVHRDLKPDNIMIGDFGEVLIVDWGIAKVLGGKPYDREWEDSVQTERSGQSTRSTRMGAVTGTPAYMSPEQAAGQNERVHFSSDLYTLGAILYEILSGKPPYSGSTAVEILSKVRTHSPPPLLPDPNSNHTRKQTIADGTRKIPAPLRIICERAMQRAISDRYPNAKELAKDVLEWLEGAQKRDQALEEVKSAKELMKQIHDQEMTYEALWEQAEEAMASRKLSHEEAWSLWEQAQQRKVSIQLLRQSYENRIRGALVYDAKLDAIHIELANLIFVPLVEAVAKGDRYQKEQCEKRLRHHLQYVSTELRDQYLHRFQSQSQNSITLQRARQGQLVGRRTLKKQIHRDLSNGKRLISLIGTAGVGKTRLALEVLHEKSEEDIRTFFCDLTEASDALSLSRLVAKTLDVHLHTKDPVAQLGEYFKEHRSVLVLDNAEHVVDIVGQIIQEWFSAAHSLQIITTSRLKLNIPKESIFSIQPLSLLEAIELFLNRGKAVRADFALTPQNRTVVGKLVQRLDRLPLAIELAAARLNIFSVQEIEERLNARFSLLRSRDDSTQALQGALDWSWELLKPWARAALSQSSIFHGGFHIKAAESVLHMNVHPDIPPVFDILHDLCENSLLRKDLSIEGEARYSMLESIRAYALQRLQSHTNIDEKRPNQISYREVGHRHARYFSRFGQPQKLDSLDGFDGSILRQKLFLELDNLVVATKHGTGNSAPLCCLAALRILAMKGPMTLGIDIANRVLAMKDVSPSHVTLLQLERTRLLRIIGQVEEARSNIPTVEILRSMESNQLRADYMIELGNIERAQSNTDRARELYEEALGIYQGLNDQRGCAEALSGLGYASQLKYDYTKALECYQTSLVIVKEIGHRVLEGKILGYMGSFYKRRGKYSDSLSYYQESISIAREIGDKRNEGIFLGNVGNVYQAWGKPQEAKSHYQRSLLIVCEIGDKKHEGSVLGNLGALYQNQGKYDEALSHYLEALSIAREIGEKTNEGTFLGNLGGVYRLKGQYPESLSYYAKSVTLAKEIGNKRIEGMNLGNMGGIFQSLGKYDEALSHYAQALSLARQIGDKVHEGIHLGNMGDTLIKLHRKEDAATHFEEAIALCNEVFPIAAGAFRGSLALLILSKERLEESHSLLETGEPQVKVYPEEYGKFLCKKAQIHLFSQQDQTARQSLAKAKEIANDIGIEPDSVFSQLIAETASMLGQS
ncbi:MAG: tetratricopeptide repeat protein, partial [Myxococcota bacterium]|nr:tetratricopeptide repeat protein [Myxococcota bacterium]